MATCLKIPYTGEARKNYERITGTQSHHERNKIYLGENNSFYWLENQLGWIHVFKPRKIKVFEKCGFSMREYRLTKQNTLIEERTGTMFDTLEECVKDFEERNREYNRLETSVFGN